MAYMGIESKKEWIYVYAQLIRFAVQKKLLQHYNIVNQLSPIKINFKI